VPSSAPCVFARVISVLTLLLLGLSFSVGQEQPKTAADKGAISGTVTDHSGAVVRDAKAVLASPFGARLAIPVDDKGAYSVTGLYPGTYTLTISADKFADKVFENINLTPGKKLTLDATLEPASANRQSRRLSRSRWNKLPLLLQVRQLRPVRKLRGTRARSPGR